MTDLQQPTRRLAERCFAASMTVERIAHLPVMVGETVDRDLWEWIEESALAPIAAHLGISEDELDASLNECGSHHRARRELFTELVAWKLRDGWLIEAAHPRWEPRGERCVSSSGSSTLRTFFATSYDAALTAAIEWAETDIATALAAGASHV